MEKIHDFVGKVKNINSKVQAKVQDSKLIQNLISKSEKDFYKAMDDDMNTPSAIAAIFKLINQTNLLLDQNKISFGEAKDVLGFFKKIDKFLDFILWQEKKLIIPEKIKELAKQREQARKSGNWQKSDELRKEVEHSGFRIEDTKLGPVIKKSA